MATLGQHGAPRLELKIVSYQFGSMVPADGEDWDANWLQIQIEVEDGIRRWKRLEPVMTTWEVQSLIDWLRTLALHKRPASNHFDMVEPCIAFAQDDEALIVEFDHEFHPDFGNADSDDEPHRVRFKTRSDDILAFADGLESELARFPAR